MEFREGRDFDPLRSSGPLCRRAPAPAPAARLAANLRPTSIFSIPAGIARPLAMREVILLARLTDSALRSTLARFPRGPFWHSEVGLSARGGLELEVTEEVNWDHREGSPKLYFGKNSMLTKPRSTDARDLISQL